MEETEELLISKENRLPPPFDRQVASISLWSDSNAAQPSYNAVLSTDLGSDIVSIDVEGSVIEVALEIYQAEVELQFPFSRFAPGRHYIELFGVNYEESVELKEDFEQHTAGQISISETPGAKLSTHRTKKLQRQTMEPRKAKFHHRGLNVITIGDWRKKTALVGNVISNYCGWRVTHDGSREYSGTIAKLNVRKNWIDFKNIEPVGESSFAKRVRRIFKSPDPSDKLKSELFPQLLKDLTFRGLQAPSQKSIATLAVAGLVVTPQSDEVTILHASPENRAISLPMSPLLQLLHAPTGQEKQVYSQILADFGKQQAKLKRPFIPGSRYTDALEAFKNIAIENSTEEILYDLKDANNKYGRNVVRDLKSLGILVFRKTSTLVFINPVIGVDFKTAFETHVKRQETIHMVDELLVSEPDASNLQIGNLVGSAIGKQWTDSSKRRNGNQLRGWSKLTGYENKGRKPILSDGDYARIEEMLSQGMRATKIAKIFGVNPETIRRKFR